MIEGAHRGIPRQVVYKGEIHESPETIPAREETHIRKSACKEFLRNIGEITPEVLIEIHPRREHGFIVYENGSEVKIHENSDLYFIHGDLQEAAKTGLAGVVKRFAIINESNEQLVMDVYAPVDEDTRQWTIKSIAEFINGTFRNENLL